MEIVRFKGNAGCRLTIAKNRFTIKFPEGLTPEQEAWVIEFTKRANAKMLPDLEVTMRGALYPQRKTGLCDRVRFRSHGKKKNYTYMAVTAEELGLEPLPMELTEKQKKRLAEEAND
jgi:hypothetical protein